MTSRRRSTPASDGRPIGSPERLCRTLFGLHEARPCARAERCDGADGLGAVLSSGAAGRCCAPARWNQARHDAPVYGARSWRMRLPPVAAGRPQARRNDRAGNRRGEIPAALMSDDLINQLSKVREFRQPEALAALHALWRPSTFEPELGRFLEP